ncbi:hypothetical protein Hanom_Chr11g01046841 [Helianthus anomalus]
MFGLIFQHMNLRHGRTPFVYIEFFFSSEPVKCIINIDCLPLIVGIGGLGIMKGNFSILLSSLFHIM